MPFIPGLSAKVLFSYLTKVEEFKTFAKEFKLYSYDKESGKYNTVFTGNSPSNLTRKDYTQEQSLHIVFVKECAIVIQRELKHVLLLCVIFASQVGRRVSCENRIVFTRFLIV